MAKEQPGIKSNITLDPENRLPIGKYEYHVVRFTESDQDTEVVHTLNPVNAEEVLYYVVKTSGPGVVYQDLSATRRPWQRTHCFLRASAPVVASVLLYIPTSDIEGLDNVPVNTIFTGGSTTIINNTTTGSGDTVEEGINVRIDVSNTAKTINAFMSQRIDSGDSPFTVDSTIDSTVILVDASSGDVEINLDQAATLHDKHLIFVKVDDSLNEVRIYPASGDTIDDFPGVVLSEQDEFAEIYSDSIVKWLSLQCCALSSTGFEGAACLTTPMKVMPSAAAGVTVTPNATSQAWSNWVEVEDVTTASWVVAGVCVNPPTGVAVAASFRVQVGVGASNEETPIGQLEGFMHDADRFRDGLMYFAAPLDKVPKGSRVSVRFRKGTTNTSNWTMKVAYFEKPLTGSLISTKTSFHEGGGFTAITASGTPWNNVSWVQVGTANHPAGRMLAGVSFIPNADLAAFEMEVGSGLTGSQRVVQTFKDASSTSAAPLGGGLYRNNILGLVTDNFTVGEPVWVRVRSSVAAGTFQIDPLWIDNFEGLDKITKKVIAWTPSAAAGTALTASATPWANPASWTQLIASTSADSALVAIALDTNANSIGDFEIDIGVGASSSEAAVTTFRANHGSYLTGDSYGIILLIPRNIASGSRVSARLRSATAGCSIHISIGLISNPDFAWRHDSQQKALPSAAADATVAANTTAWTSSSTCTLVAANTITSDYKVTGLSAYGFNTVEFETDLLVNDVVAYTIPGRSATNDPGMLYKPLPMPLCVPANASLKAQFRKSGTTAGTWSISATYV